MRLAWTSASVVVVSLSLFGGLAAIAVPAGVNAPTSASDATSSTLDPVGAPAAAAKSSTGVLALDPGAIGASRAQGTAYIVMQPWEYSRIKELRERNPGVKILMYKNGAATRQDHHESGLYSTGVSYREAADNKWLLRDAAGTVLHWTDWSLYPVNVADRDYQDTWTANVVSELRSGRWDGVLIDDTLTRLSHSISDHRVATAIPNDKAMHAATASFLKNVGPKIRKSGFLAIPNLTDVDYKSWKPTMTAWSKYVSGWENEFGVKWGLDDSEPRFSVDDDWAWNFDMAKWCATHDIPLLSVTYSNQTDTTTQTYQRATWLLSWNGRTGASFFVPFEAQASFFVPFEAQMNGWLSTATTDLGAPTAGAMLAKSTGVYTRTYRNGLVVVNPTEKTRTVRVSRAMHYRTVGGKAVTSVRVQGKTGVLLRR